MFPSHQSVTTKYNSEFETKSTTLSGETIAHRLSRRLFDTHVVCMQLCQYWLRFSLTSHTSLIGFVFDFAHFILHEPVHFSISDKTFNLFKSLRYAASFDSIDPFDHKLMSILLAQKDNILFEHVIASGNSVRAENFKFNLLIEQRFDRWTVLEWFFYYMLRCDRARVFTTKGVLSCVIQKLHTSTVQATRTMPSPHAVQSTVPTERLQEIVDNFRCW